MDSAIASTEPRSLWSHFATILTLPRPSKHEERIVGWIREWAAKHGFECVADATGNLVVRVPGSPGHENAPTVILQSHLDMVCEKNGDTGHDFHKDPIPATIEGDWVVTEGTTLGADNGIGVAASMAVAVDESVVHGPLELLFTIDEETGLTGAAGLDGSLLTGRLLLNLDSEDEGILYVGCAGGADSRLQSGAGRAAPAEDAVTITVDVRGLRGGHSGMDIDDNRGNAIILLARSLRRLDEEGISWSLHTFEGGGLTNAIPREASAAIAVSREDADAAMQCIDQSASTLKEQYSGPEKDWSVTCSGADSCTHLDVLIDEDRRRLLSLLLALPNGVLAMSREIPGLVETSNNLAIVRVAGENMQAITSSRSSLRSARDGVLQQIAACAELAGFGVELTDSYPGWQPNMSSRALTVLREVYTEMCDGKAPQVTAVHAGLECGLLAERIPGLAMVSFGPTIRHAHSPDERVSIPSVARFWEALKKALKRFGDEPGVG